MCDRAVIILGAPRSGTTFLGTLLSGFKGVAYVEEPNVIWRYKNFKRFGHDEFRSNDASQEVTKYIRKKIKEKALHENPKFNTIVEKTPANCLRPYFVDRVFPRAKYIFIFRDYQDVVDSIKRKWLYEFDQNASLLNDKKKFRQLRMQFDRFCSVPWSDKTYYMKTVLSEVLFHVYGRPRSFWGPRYSGYREDFSKDIDYKISQQWLRCNSRILDFYHEIPDEKKIALRYTDLDLNHDDVIKELSEFLESKEDLYLEKKIKSRPNIDSDIKCTIPEELLPDIEFLQSRIVKEVF